MVQEVQEVLQVQVVQEAALVLEAVQEVLLEELAVVLVQAQVQVQVLVMVLVTGTEMEMEMETGLDKL